MDLCKMFEFDCKVTQNISINRFLSLKINNFYILQQYSTKIPHIFFHTAKLQCAADAKPHFVPICAFLPILTHFSLPPLPAILHGFIFNLDILMCHAVFYNGIVGIFVEEFKVVELLDSLSLTNRFIRGIFFIDCI